MKSAIKDVPRKIATDSVSGIPPPRGITTEAVLVLFQSNLNAIREWYRNQAGSGREFGHFVLMEMMLGATTMALAAAMEGKTWQPPK